MHNALYGKHISLKISKDNIFEDISDFENFGDLEIQIILEMNKNKN